MNRAHILILVLIVVAAATAAGAGIWANRSTPASERLETGRQTASAAPIHLEFSLFAKYSDIPAGALGWHVLESNDASLLAELHGRIDQLGTPDAQVVERFGGAKIAVTMTEFDDTAALSSQSCPNPEVAIGAFVTCPVDDSDALLTFPTGETSIRGRPVYARVDAADGATARKFVASLRRVD